MRNNKQQKVQFTFLFHEKQKNEKGQRKTVAGIIKGNTIQMGVSICGPRDQFNRKLGTVIATGRASKKPCKILSLTADDDKRQIFFDALKTL